MSSQPEPGDTTPLADAIAEASRSLDEAPVQAHVGELCDELEEGDEVYFVEINPNKPACPSWAPWA